MQDAFDHNVLSTDKILIHSYNTRKYAVVEEDKTVQRVRLQVDLYLYSKEE